VISQIFCVLYTKSLSIRIQMPCIVHCLGNIFFYQSPIIYHYIHKLCAIFKP
jgi:hypothetical protein